MKGPSRRRGLIDHFHPFMHGTAGGHDALFQATRLRDVDEGAVAGLQSLHKASLVGESLGLEQQRFGVVRSARKWRLQVNEVERGVVLAL